MYVRYPDPRKQMDKDEFGEWIIPVLLNGDYYIFLTKDDIELIEMHQ